MLLVGCGRDPAPGPLEPPPEERDAENISTFHVDVGHRFTFGLLFIRNHGDQPAVLDSVELVDSSGGIEVDGMRVADITGDRRTWSSADDFPPRRPAEQRPLAAFEVAPSETVDVQLLLGLNLTEDGQHGFRGVAVLCHVGENAFRYEIPSGVVACSPSYFEQTGRRTCFAGDLFEP
jgi:hypothetical protein